MKINPRAFSDKIWSGKPPGEKLATLKERLKGSAADDQIYGLGGGEDVYQQALRRLNLRFGRRDVMRATHMQALDKISPVRICQSLRLSAIGVWHFGE